MEKVNFEEVSEKVCRTVGPGPGPVFSGNFLVFMIYVLHKIACMKG